MSLKRMMLWAAVGALTVGSLACGKAEQPAATNGNISTTSTPAPTAAGPKVIKEEAGPDNSQIVVRQNAEGDTVTVRKWESGPVRRLIKREHKGEVKQVRVVTRDGKAYRVEDKNLIEHALDWTGAQLAEAAAKMGKAVNAGADAGEDAADEVGDKAEDAKDQAVKGAKEVGDKAEDVKDKTVEGAKKVGEKLKP